MQAAASIKVVPTTVSAGGTATVSGDVLNPDGQPGCLVPGGVRLFSGAFAGQGVAMNQDIEAAVGADGSYDVNATILPEVVPGTYTIVGRCGGANLAVAATLIVTP